jgi:hypothetical protein
LSGYRKSQDERLKVHLDFDLLMSNREIIAAPNKRLHWTDGNVTHFAKRKMRAIAARQ